MYDNHVNLFSEAILLIIYLVGDDIKLLNEEMQLFLSLILTRKKN